MASLVKGNEWSGISRHVFDFANLQMCTTVHRNEQCHFRRCGAKIRSLNTLRRQHLVALSLVCPCVSRRDKATVIRRRFLLRTKPSFETATGVVEDKRHSYKRSLHAEMQSAIAPTVDFSITQGLSRTKQTLEWKKTKHLSQDFPAYFCHESLIQRVMRNKGFRLHPSWWLTYAGPNYWIYDARRYTIFAPPSFGDAENSQQQS